MRQRLKLVFPVLLLALLAQIFAPVESNVAMRADALAGTPGCSVAAHSADGEHQTPPVQHRRAHQCCVLCHVPQAVDPAPLAVTFAALAPAARDIAWTVDRALAPAAPTAKHTRARAPPSVS